MTDLDAIKQKSIVEYLDSLGIKPKSTHGRTTKFLCPWRGESIPSLHVYPSNTWTDFGDRSGGTIIELVEKLHGVDFIGALTILKGNNVRQVSQLPPKEEEPAIKIIYTKTIESPWLCQYLSKRCISIDVARQYCKESRVELKNDKGEPYRKTCISWLNDKGGRDFRSPKAKLCCSPKYLTTYNKGKDELYLFEGMFDLLAWMSAFGMPPKTVIVLNSIVFIDYIDFSQYQVVHYVCDKDKSGDQGFDKINHTNKIDERDVFKPFKDVSEWWENKQSKSLYTRELMSI
jgi:hypothetical protein